MTLHTDLRQSVPFPDVETAWFWAMREIEARREGRPVDERLDVIVKALDRLYRQRKIELAHARILRIWGERGRAPNHRDAGDLRLWREAIDRLTWPLKVKGIIT